MEQSDKAKRIIKIVERVDQLAQQILEIAKEAEGMLEELKHIRDFDEKGKDEKGD